MYSVESFITAVYSLAELCDFRALKEGLIRDQIIVGIHDTRLSESLLLDADLTLEKAITRVRQSAAVKKQHPILRGAEQPIAQVESIHRNDRKMQTTFKKKIEPLIGMWQMRELKETSLERLPSSRC